MSEPPVVVVGGGGHARVVIEAARTAGLEVLGFVDRQPCAETSALLGVRRLGDDDALLAHPGAGLLLGIGAVAGRDARREIVARLGAARWPAVVHARAWVSPSATLGPGAIVLAGAVVNAGARLGAFAVVNSGAVVEHDVRLGEFAQVAPGGTVGGGAVIGDGAFVGLGAAVRDHVRVGAGAVVAMGAAVVADVEPYTVVRGVPARPVGPAARP